MTRRSSRSKAQSKAQSKDRSRAPAKAKAQTKAKQKASGSRSAPAASCPRCGERRPLFWHGRHELCEACIHDGRHPIETTPIDFGTLLRETARLGREVGWRGVVIAAGMHVPLAALFLTTDLDPLLGPSIYAAVGSMLALGAVTDLSLRRLDGDPLQMGAALGTAVRRWPALFLAQLVAQLVIMVSLFLLIVPGVLKYLSYLIINPLILARDARSVDALEISRTRMVGHRRPAFGAALVCFVPPLVLFGGYLALRDASVADAAVLDAVNAVLTPVADLPAIYLAVVLHAKLRRPQRSRT